MDDGWLWGERQVVRCEVEEVKIVVCACVHVFLPVLLVLHLAEVWVVWWSTIRNSFWPCKRDSPLVEIGIGNFLEDMWRWVRVCG